MLSTLHFWTLAMATRLLSLCAAISYYAHYGFGWILHSTIFWVISMALDQTPGSSVSEPNLFFKNQRIQLEVLYNSAKLKFKIPKKFMTFEHICEGWSNFCIETVLVKCQLRVKFWLFSLSFECPFSPAIYPLSTTVIVFSDFSVVLRALFSCL